MRLILEVWRYVSTEKLFFIKFELWLISRDIVEYHYDVVNMYISENVNLQTDQRSERSV